jgi:hypothetical protein
MDQIPSIKTSMAMKENKPISLTGTFIYADVKNANNRIYPIGCVLDMMNQAQQHIQNGSLLGELDFPDRPEVTLGNVSHRVTEVHFNPEKNTLEGTIQVLEGSPKGRILKDQIEACGGAANFLKNMACIRSRGTGTINEKGEVENYTLYSFDVIAQNQDPFRDVIFAPISKDPLEDIK